MESVKKLRSDSGISENPDDDGNSDGGEAEPESGSGSESESSIDPNAEFKVEFEARSIESSDFLGIRRLLQQLFLKASIDLSGLTNLVIAKSSLYGSTIKVGSDNEDPGSEEVVGDKGMEGEGDEVCGITTFIPITHNQDHKCVQQLKEHLLSQCKCHSSNNFEQLSTLLSDPDRPVGLLVSERLLNLPAQIGLLLLRSLLGELSENLPPASACQLVVVIARSHVHLTADVGQKRKTRDGPLDLQREQQTFDYIENECMLKDCLLSFSYSVSVESDQVFGGRWSSDDCAMKPLRTVMILPFSKLEHVATALEKELA